VSTSTAPARSTFQIELNNGPNGRIKTSDFFDGISVSGPPKTHLWTPRGSLTQVKNPWCGGILLRPTFRRLAVFLKVYFFFRFGQEYKEELRENLPPGHVISHVHATDVDTGLWGSVHYSVSKRNKDAARKLVRIDEVTGDVILRQKLDRERHDG